MYEMLTGEPPFTAGSIKDLLHVILNSPLKIPEKVRAKSLLAADAIEQLLHKDPTQRLGHGGGAATATLDGTVGTTAGVEEVKAHPFFGGIDWDKLLAKDPSIEPPFKPASSKNPLLHFDKKMTAMKMTALSVHESTGGTLCTTQSCDPFADFGYDGVVPLPEPEPEMSPVPVVIADERHNQSLSPPIEDSSEVGVPPPLRGQREGSIAPEPASSGVVGTSTDAPPVSSGDDAAETGTGGFLTAQV